MCLKGCVQLADSFYHVAGLEDLMTEEEVDSVERSAPSRDTPFDDLDDSNSLGSGESSQLL